MGPKREGSKVQDRRGISFQRVRGSPCFSVTFGDTGMGGDNIYGTWSCLPRRQKFHHNVNTLVD